MAKVRSIISIKGSIGDLVFYHLNGKQICRTSDPNRSEKVKHSEAFINSRKCSSLFTACNAMATAIYRMAKNSGARIDYMRHGELVKKIYNRFYSTPNALPERIAYRELQRTLGGFGFMHRRDARSVPVASVLESGVLNIRIGDVSDVVLIVGTRKPAVLTKDGYLVENEMEEVLAIEVNEDVELEVGEDNFVLVVVDGDVWVV